QPLALSADGTTLARLSAPNGVVLWDLASGKAPRPAADRALAWHADFHPDHLAGCFAFSPDGQRIASLCADGKVRLWEAATGTEAWLPGWRLPRTARP